MAELTLRAPAGEDDLGACWRLLCRSFNFPAADEERFRKMALPGRMVLGLVGDDVAALAQVRPFGQFFGGRSVPMGGFSPVAAAPEHRGHGHASAVTAAQFALMRERGEVLAGLYPASTRLYRRLGFELGGVWAVQTVPARALRDLAAGPVPDRPVRRGTADDIPAVKRCYRRAAVHHPGWLDRPDHWWQRILVDPFDELHLYVVDGEPGEVAGYVNYGHRAPPGRPWGYTVEVRELVGEEGGVDLALWRLVGSSSTQAETVEVVGPLEHPLLHLLPEQDLRPGRQLRWMLRLVDAPGAVAARGFPAGVSAAADLEVVDEHCPWNTGRWHLTVENGEGRLEPGGAGTVVLGAGALASLYSGYAVPRTLAALAPAFSGPTPWMPDFF